MDQDRSVTLPLANDLFQEDSMTAITERRARARRFAIGLSLATVASIAHGQATKHTAGDAKPPRIPPVERSAADPAQLELLGEPGSPTLNVTATVAQHPVLAKAWLPFARHVLVSSTLPARDRELLILRIGWLCRAEYEWGHHAVLARSTGLTDDELRRITRGPEAEGWSAHDSALLRAVDELHDEARIGDATWAALAERYTTQQMMDVVFTVGEYNLVSMALRSFGVEREEGVEGFPAEGSPAR
jgi:4-carboxymuconolactone decarboxylase